MTRAILTLIFCMHLLLPATVWAQQVAKGPMNYSLKVYGGILAVALLGGLVGQGPQGGVAHVEHQRPCRRAVHQRFRWADRFLPVRLHGLAPRAYRRDCRVSGHAGTKAINWVEGLDQRFAEKKLGIDTTIPNKEPPA